MNLNFVQAIEFAAKQEWGSFRADWYQNRIAKQQPITKTTAQILAEQRMQMDRQQGGFIDVGEPKKPLLIEGVGHA